MRTLENKKKTKLNKEALAAWALTGVIICLSIAVMILTGSHHFSAVNNSGKVHDFFESEFAGGKFSLTDGTCVLSAFLSTYDEKYKYLYVDMDIPDGEEIKTELRFNDAENIQKAVISQTLKDGENVITLPEETGEFTLIGFYFAASQIPEKGVMPQIKNLQLREQIKKLSFWKITGTTVLLLLFYTGVSIAARMLIVKRKWRFSEKVYAFVDAIEDFYLLFLQKFTWFTKNITNKHKSRYITCLLFSLFMGTIIIEIFSLYKYYKYIAVFYCIILLAVSLLMPDSELKKPNWKNPITICWLCLSGWMCISDFLVPKNEGWVGYTFLLVFGVLYFALGNMEKPGNFIKNILFAIQGCFVVVVFLCIFIFPYNNEERYAGFSKNPSVFAMYVNIMALAILSQINSLIELKAKYRYFIFPVGEIIAAVILLWRAQSLGPTAVFLLLGGAICILKWLRPRVKQLIKGKKVIFAVALICILFVSVFQIVSMHSIMPLDDTGSLSAPESEETLPQEESRLYKKVTQVSSLESFTSGRTIYWKAYIRNMNMYGHSTKLIAWKPILPHNAFIGISYKYGVVAIIPYILLFVLTIKKAGRLFTSRAPYGVAPFLLIAGSFLMSMTDNVEQPFKWLPWIMEYILIGLFFTKGNVEDV